MASKEKREEIEQNGKKDTYIYFLSNFYNKKIYDSENKQTSGNAGITFIPSSNNRFYIFQKNLIIYEKSSGGNDKGEGELKETGGNVQLSNPVTDLSKINPKETYYFAIDYYVPEENSDNSEGRYVQYATAHKGAEFLDEKGESYLTYYDTAKKQEVSKKGQDVVVTTKKERKE